MGHGGDDWFTLWSHVLVPLVPDHGGPDFEVPGALEAWAEKDAHLTSDMDATPSGRHVRAVDKEIGQRLGVIDGRSWLGDSGLHVLVATTYSDDASHDLNKAHVGRRTKDGNVEVRVDLDYETALATPPAVLARSVVRTLLTGFDVMAGRYRLPPFPVEQMHGLRQE